MIQLKMASYYDNIDNYHKVDTIVETLLTEHIRRANIHTMQISHRIKTVESTSEKITRKPEKYTTATDLTDIIGFRIICYYTEQIDMIGEIIERLFDVDKDNYVDKSTKLSPNAFGYLSVHYICSLKPSDSYSEELCSYKFEIQIRTVLQHTWAEIEHDLGYKNEFGVPHHVRREFSQMASLLEVADAGFMRIKHELDIYSKVVADKLRTGDVANVSIDSLSLREFMKYNDDFIKFTKDIAAISNATLMRINPDNFINQLEFFDVKTLGDLIKMQNDNQELAMKLAYNTLHDSEIDELASTVGLFYLCRAALISGPYNQADIYRYLEILLTKESLIEKQANHLLKQREMYVGSESGN